MFSNIFKLLWTSDAIVLVSIGSRNGLSPIRRQAITRTCADLLFSGPLGTSFCQIYSQNTIIFIQEKTFEVVVRKPPAIFFSP